MGRLKCQCNIKNCKIVTFTSSSFILLFLRFPDISSQFNSSKPESKILPHNSQSPLPPHHFHPLFSTYFFSFSLSSKQTQTAANNAKSTPGATVTKYVCCPPKTSRILK